MNLFKTISNDLKGDMLTRKSYIISIVILSIFQFALAIMIISVTYGETVKYLYTFPGKLLNIFYMFSESIIVYLFCSAIYFRIRTIKSEIMGSIGLLYIIAIILLAITFFFQNVFFPMGIAKNFPAMINYGLFLDRLNNMIGFNWSWINYGVILSLAIPKNK